MNMKRNIIQQMLHWKNAGDRKPLVLQGARQTGKTYIVTQFGASAYANTVYCNFEKEPLLSSLFTDLSPRALVPKLGALKRQQILPAETLIIFDEVQACPPALTSLKYFCEEANEYHIIALGSLLGVSVNRGTSSFPVGKVQFMTMHPMDFEEYLLAQDETLLVERIRQCYETNTALEAAFHERALSLYREYLFVGGMPAVVAEFIKSRNPQLASIFKSDILEAYHNDMGKNNKQSEIPKTRLVYRNISTQLAKENRKFFFGQVKKRGGARAMSS